MQPVPRIPYEDLPPDLKAELAPRVERLGYLGEFFQIGAHQPEALGHFIRYTETLKDVLPSNLVELSALTVSTWSGNAYERVQHERLSLKLGFSEAWVRQIEALDPGASDGLYPVEKLAQKMVLAVIRTQGREARPQSDALLAATDPATVVGVLMTVGRYLAHSAICNTLGVQPPVASPLA